MSQIDMDKLFEQVRTLQQKMQETQASLGRKTVTGQAGGGLVTVTANGLREIVSIQLDPICVDNRDVKMLEDLVVAATNQALREAAALAQREMAGMAGLPPGFGGLVP